jgi:imidazole glycerol-phosphate synthase subunit HisH
MTVRLVLLDSGGANLGSVQAAFSRLGIDAPVTSDEKQIRNASHVILPGVGAAASAMQKLRSNGLFELIPTLTQPVMGICVGMQLLFDYSEEGDTPCLGLLPGKVKKIRPVNQERVPHMGWNQLNPIADSALCAGLNNGYAYFVHSYAVDTDQHTLMSTNYAQPLSAVVGNGRVFGAQFHPERSAAIGQQLLKNFLSL